MKTYDLQNFGTVMSLDLKRHDVFGEVKIELAPGEISRIIEAFYDQLPEKTAFDKKYKSSLSSKLLLGKPNLIINIYPVLNIPVLKEYKSLKV